MDTSSTNQADEAVLHRLSDARTLFISDLHLGSRFSQVKPLLALLDRVLPQRIYIVGDLIDSRRLRCRPYWTADCTRLLSRLFDFAMSGTTILYTPGNHDRMLRQFTNDFRLFSIEDQFIHQCINGRRMMVMHGDQFDDVERKMKWLSELGSTAYEMLLATDRSINWALSYVTNRRFPLSRELKNSAKRIVQRKSSYREKLADFARQNNCDGVICGHIHRPEISELEGFRYCNTGDWIEHCTALVEFSDGELQLVYASELDGLHTRRPILDRLKGRRRQQRATYSNSVAANSQNTTTASEASARE